MREIKFRAWDKEMKKMDYGNGELTGYNNFDCSPLKTVNDIINENYPELEWMQYTGLKDKNGKEIYEGDIVIVTEEYGYLSGQDTGTGEIVMLEGLWYIGGNIQNGLFDIDTVFYIEVIGNIYENPELLKEGEE